MNLCVTTTHDNDDHDDACDDVVIFSGLLWETRLVIISPKTQFENLSCYFFSFPFLSLVLPFTTVWDKTFPSITSIPHEFFKCKSANKGNFSFYIEHTHTKKEKVKKKVPPINIKSFYLTLIKMLEQTRCASSF